MARWTIAREFALQHRPKINTGKVGLYLWFDYVLRPISPQAPVEIVLSPAVVEQAALRFEPLKRGMVQGLASRPEGREIVGLQVEVTNILFHDFDTSIEGCEMHGRWFVQDLVGLLVPVP